MARNFKCSEGKRVYKSGGAVEWNDGKFDAKEEFVSGKTKRTLNDGRRYEGDWSNGDANGNGEASTADEKHVYTGPFVNGQMHGDNGTFFNHSHSDSACHYTVAGQFRDNQLNGNAICTF